MIHHERPVYKPIPMWPVWVFRVRLVAAVIVGVIKEAGMTPTGLKRSRHDPYGAQWLGPEMECLLTLRRRGE